MKMLFTWTPHGIRLTQPSDDDPNGKYGRTEQWFQVTIPDDTPAGVELEYAVSARFDRLLRQWRESEDQ